jgi:LmbE family N-acetylglucosaminyl deacetylase
MSKNILLLTSHLDDFEFGMGGTAAHLCREFNVYLFVACKGDRPGAVDVARSRKSVCLSNCEQLGIKDVLLYEYSDTYLDTVNQTELCNIVSDCVNNIKPNIVYTHNNDDVHNDHRILSNISRVVCRMRQTSPVDELYEFSIPGSTEWMHRPNHFNVYQDVTDTYDVKMEMVSRYTTEIKTEPDPLSLEMIKARDAYHGSICGYNYAEIFNLVFKR